ncbi:MAG: Chromate transport protein [Candidatus Ordinivivax streblomastigis]|uniref:Chromate transport protein n=1 Tax=Candidatus Ordinivivax streblomastigis TaxID=2540710 RepID=A0A5M8P1X6_9BACT|nr:MAG: Chromate transport protein [Candidatus Ordinivivax streblomastigis]
MMNVYGQIFGTFAKVGTFTIGGGYAMLPLIQKEVVEKKRWVSSDAFVDMIALSQSVPGVMAVNISILTGYHIKGIRGSMVAALGTILPSFFLLLLIAMFFRNFQDNVYIAKMFKAIRPAVVALIAVPVFTTAQTIGMNLKTVVIPVASALLIWYWGVSPVYVVLVAAIGGVVYGIATSKT